MLATQRVVKQHRQRHLHSVDERGRLDISAAHVETLRSEAETLEVFHATPLPPGYAVIFTIDDKGRTIYSLRVPPGVNDDPLLVAENMRIVLAEAWDRHYTRMPDALERLMRGPPQPRSHLWRTLWEMALHHLAYYELTFALNFAEHEVSVGGLNELSIASGSLKARRVGRL